MRIGIDTFGCDHARSGIGAYLYYLASNLPVLDSVEYNLFGSAEDRYTYGAENSISYTEVKIPESLKAERLWHFMLSGHFASSQKYDAVIYAGCSRVFPFSFRVPGIAIINDILSMSLLDFKSPVSKQLIISGLKKSAAIIASSQVIKEDLLSIGIPEDKISVVPIGIDHSQFYQHPLLDSDIIDLKPFAIKRPYIIYPSRISSSSKKHIELIKAFTLFKEKTGLPHRLVLAGAETEYSEEVHRAAISSAYSSDIFITGFFPHESFPLLNSGAAACVFPSVSEGVALPVLEAMASGIPVAASNSGAIPEISGGNAVLFDSDKIEEMAAAIETVCCDKKKRDSMVLSGLEWSSRFNWKTTAARILEITRSVIQ